MKRNENNLRPACETAAGSNTTLGVLKTLPLSRISYIFEDCTNDELQYFMQRAIHQEEYELCKHLKELMAMRTAA